MNPIKVELAERLGSVEEYYFSKKLREIDEMRAAGREVINLGIGSPDQPPHPEVVATLAAEAAKPGNHGYQPYKGAAVLRNAFAAWYRDRYGVTLDPVSEILPLIGSKEGIMHVCMTYLDKGDKVLVPNPGYPTYRSAATIAGIIADESAIGMVNQKTTAVRIIPVEGKHVGDTVEFGGLLGYAPIMPVNRFSCEAFVNRGGRIPAPIHSFKN